MVFNLRRVIPIKIGIVITLLSLAVSTRDFVVQ